MINKKCPLLLFDLYFYDFSSCYPRILKSLGYELPVDLDDKEKRNIYIGKIQRNNPDLSKFLRNTVQDLLDYYKFKNNILEEEVIISQTDGFIIKKKLNDTSSYMELNFRGYVDFLILTPDRKKFLFCIDNTIYVKGISNLYDNLWEIYNRFKNLNFLDKTSLYKQMEKIKDQVLFSNNKELFKIDVGDGKKVLQMIEGQRSISEGVDFDLSKVNKQKYFDHYFSEFLSSIVAEIH